MATTTITYVKHSPVLSNATLLSTRFHYVTLIHDIRDVFLWESKIHMILFLKQLREKNSFTSNLYKTLQSVAISW